MVWGLAIADTLPTVGSRGERLVADPKGRTEFAARAGAVLRAGADSARFGSPLTAAKRGLPPMSRDSLRRSTGTPHPLTVRVCVLTVSVRPREGHDINDDVCVPLQRLWAF